MATPRKKVLVLGAGYVSEPAVEYLTREKRFDVTVASALKEEADNVAKKFDTESILLDVVERPDLLAEAIKDAELVLSLLPYNLHPVIAEQCIKHKVNMVTASYLTPQLKQLHQAAQDAGVTIVNEVGLDPGIDHLLAMECFDEVNRDGGKVESFISYCGGLPAPECSGNSLRYKFSWSPRGVLLNTFGSSKYLWEGKEVEIPAGGQLLDNVRQMSFLPGFNLEGFPNRDCTPYIGEYGITGARSVLRGTLRYKGYSNTIKGLLKLGLLDTEHHPSLHPKGPEITWRQYVCTLLGQQDNIYSGNLQNILLERVGGDRSRAEAIEELGFLSDDKIVKLGSPLDTISHYLAKRLAYCPNERDIVILHHEIVINWPDAKRELRSINLVCYGEPQGYSAMAKTVGYPAAIAAKMVLEGEIQRKGMVVPLTPDMYTPILHRLKQEGIVATETSKTLE